MFIKKLTVLLILLISSSFSMEEKTEFSKLFEKHESASLHVKSMYNYVGMAKEEDIIKNLPKLIDMIKGLLFYSAYSIDVKSPAQVITGKNAYGFRDSEENAADNNTLAMEAYLLGVLGAYLASYPEKYTSPEASEAALIKKYGNKRGAEIWKDSGDYFMSIVNKPTAKSIIHNLGLDFYNKDKIEKDEEQASHFEHIICALRLVERGAGGRMDWSETGKIKSQTSRNTWLNTNLPEVANVDLNDIMDGGLTEFADAGRDRLYKIATGNKYKDLPATLYATKARLDDKLVGQPTAKDIDTVFEKPNKWAYNFYSQIYDDFIRTSEGTQISPDHLSLYDLKQEIIEQNKKRLGKDKEDSPDVTGYYYHKTENDGEYLKKPLEFYLSEQYQAYKLSMNPLLDKLEQRIKKLGKISKALKTDKLAARGMYSEEYYNQMQAQYRQDNNLGKDAAIPAEELAEMQRQANLLVEKTPDELDWLQSVISTIKNRMRVFEARYIPFISKVRKLVQTGVPGDEGGVDNYGINYSLRNDDVMQYIPDLLYAYGTLENAWNTLGRDSFGYMFGSNYKKSNEQINECTTECNLFDQGKVKSEIEYIKQNQNIGNYSSRAYNNFGDKPETYEDYQHNAGIGFIRSIETARGKSYIFRGQKSNGLTVYLDAEMRETPFNIVPKTLYDKKSLRKVAITGHFVPRIDIAFNDMNLLHELRFEDIYYKDNILEDLHLLDDLRHLSIRDVVINEKHIKAISKIENLESLALNRTTATKLLDELGNLKKLKRVDIKEDYIYGSSIDDAIMLFSRLEAIPKFIFKLPELERLELGDYRINIEEALKLKEIKTLKFINARASNSDVNNIINEINNRSKKVDSVQEEEEEED